MSLSTVILSVLIHFQTAFSQPTWNKVQVLLIGTMLAHGRRTVTAALRQMGLSNDVHFTNYHQTLNRASWSEREVSKRLLCLIVKTFSAIGSQIYIVVDEHLERRWGSKITKRGHHRDPMLSSKKRMVTNSGLRWIVMAVVIRLPWTNRHWALPFLSVLAPSKQVNAKLGLRHKTVPELARQMITLVRRWLHNVPITLMGDTTYSVLELGLRCTKLNMNLIAPLRLDARLYSNPDLSKGNGGRPRVKGNRLPSLNSILTNSETAWQLMTVSWYSNRQQKLEVVSGTALWYRCSLKPLPIRWVLVRDPAGELDSRAYFSTDTIQSEKAIIEDFVKRWTIEVTFEESRAHLGIETQRQWTDKAIERTTPSLFGLFSIVSLLANSLHSDGRILVQATAWYKKQYPTFADALASVRAHLWCDFNFSTSPHHPDMVLIPKSVLNRLIYSVCYSH